MNNGNHNHGGHGFGLALLVGAIYFAFGERVARTVVQVCLLAVVGVVLYALVVL